MVVDNTEPHLRDLDALDRIGRTPKLTLISADNVGYLGAVRLALEVLPEINEAAFLVVGNTDLKLRFDELAMHLLAVRQELGAQRVGVVAPRLVGLDGVPAKQMHLVKPPSARKMKRLALLFSNYRSFGIYRLAAELKRRMPTFVAGDGGALSGGQELFAPHGSLMIFSESYLEISDAFDFPCFLFGEEIFVGLQLRRARLRCIYDDSISYSHVGHGSMGNLPSPTVVRYMRDAHGWAAEALR